MNVLSLGYVLIAAFSVAMLFIVLKDRRNRS
jgi:hypothetical protein